MESVIQKRVKVLHIITRLILGGAQENTLYTVEGLEARPEYEVYLATGPALGPEGTLFDRVSEQEVRVILIPEMRREIHPYRDLVTFFRLTSLCRRLRPQVVHTHSSKAGILGRFAAWVSGVPLIVHTIHGLPFHPYQRRSIYWLYVWLEWLAARVSRRIITVSNHMADRASWAGVAPRERLEAIYSGMQVESFMQPDPAQVALLKARYGLRDDQRVAGVVARLAPLKGHEFLFGAAVKLAEKHPDLVYLLVGDGELREAFSATIEQLGLRERFIFCGLVRPETIPAHLALMDLVVHPSLREGLARVLPQGILAGKPVVSFDLDSADEAVVPGRTGYLVRPEDVDGLADAIDQVLCGELEAPDPAEQAAFVDRFRWQTMVDAIHQLYRRELNNDNARATG